MNKFPCDCGFVVDRLEVEWCTECKRYKCIYCFIPQSLICFACRVKQYQLDSLNQIAELLDNDTDTTDDET